jgi:hypothetical protein
VDGHPGLRGLDLLELLPPQEAGGIEVVQAALLSLAASISVVTLLEHETLVDDTFEPAAKS